MAKGLPSLRVSRRTWRRRAYQLRAQIVAVISAVRIRLAPIAQRLQPAATRLPAKEPLLAVTALIAVIVITFVVGNPKARPHQPARPAAKAVTTSTDHPSEAPITTATYHSTATGTEPEYLNLPTVHAEGYVQKVGVDQHQQIAVPTNINLAGWFSSTVTPGDLGLSIIDGHLDGYHRPGIFARLAALKPGDQFSVKLANGTKRTFRVRTTQSLPTDQAASVLFSQIPGVARQLNLITCGGTFNKTSGYDHRVVVAASLVN